MIIQQGSKRVIRKEILFRLENFGGIIINKHSFKRIELTTPEALFVYAAQYTNDINAKSIVCAVLHINSLDITKVLNLDIFEDVINGEQLPYEEVLKQTELVYQKMQSYHCLSFPLEIAIYPSMKCNLNCKFCFVGDKTDTLIYDADKWGEVLSLAKKKGVLSISILGGEPSLYYDIDKLLLKCEELELNTVITTNGLMWKERTKEIVCSSKYITPVVSMQSLDNLNLLLMGCDSNIQRKFIEKILANGKRVRVNSVYTYQTPEQIISVYDYCASVGVERYSVANYSNVKNNTEMCYAHTLQDLAILDDRVKSHIKHRYSSCKNIPYFSAEGCMLYSCYADTLQGPLKFTSFEKQYYGCRGKYTKMEIFSDGAVYPCCRFETIRSSTSNVFTDRRSIDEIWNNDKNYIELRNQRTLNSTCHECVFCEICQGGCYPSRLKIYNSTAIFEKDPNCCIQEGKHDVSN